MKKFLSRASELAEFVKRQREVLIVTHIDADGITSGSIAKKALEDHGIEVKIRFVKQLDRSEVERIRDENKFVWFTDLGSGQLKSLRDMDFIITDHHLPEMSCERQLNPHEFGIDGSIEMSGAVATLMVANRISMDIRLSELAIVGAVGDLQDSRFGKLVGFNRKLVEFLNGEIVSIQRDLRFFGKQTRPIAKMLEYNTDPLIPGITGDEAGCLRFLSSLGIDPWIKWIEIGIDDKRKIVSALVKLCIELGLGYDEIKRIAGECYILLQQPEACEKRDAMEFSTLLNATARYGESEVGMAVCFGNEKAFIRARTLLQNHRKNLANGLRFVEEIGIKELKNIQYFHAGREIKDTIVGIVAGMSLVKNPRKPIIAFAESEKGIKVSARATYKLVDMGLNLSKVIKIASEAVGGSGGGHNIAAGALIPFGSEERFLKILDELIDKQIVKSE
ncbi:MAG: DHH family phosphoesterase [Archaeoglobaceae archaeon]|nr:DHH family phosphoesterase [Archaeoglobaceae archaeon]MDW8117626.1 DHH family phosphoesterase [Archaeoglobaceae archaeon]